MNCELCESVNEKYRLVKETKHSFSVICKEPIKDGHILIMPKRHVTQTKFSTLPLEETQDLFALIEELQEEMDDIYEDHCILLKNPTKFSSQEHLHFHLVPCKGSLRELFNALENTPLREEATMDDFARILKQIKKEA